MQIYSNSVSTGTHAIDRKRTYLLGEMGLGICVGIRGRECWIHVGVPVRDLKPVMRSSPSWFTQNRTCDPTLQLPSTLLTMPPAAPLSARNIRRAAIMSMPLSRSIPRTFSIKLIHRLVYQSTCPNCFKTFSTERRCQQHQAMKAECRAAAEYTLRLHIKSRKSVTGA
jgi:hypothetical protein